MLLLTLMATAWADTCERWDDPRVFAQHNDFGVESSGLVWSRTRPDVWFTHGDRGDAAELVAFHAQQGVIERHAVVGAPNDDWEDLAAAPCPDEGDCIYIGDIGDNDGDRDSVRVFAVREPEAGGTARAIRTWEAVYPGGPRDAEALLVHPCTLDILVITKDDTGLAGVFRFPTDGSKVLEHVGQFTLSGDKASSRRVTGADFDADGDRVIVRTGDRLWEWDVDPAAPNAHWTTAPREVANLVEAQGEAVTYGPDGGLWTTSEGIPATLSVLACEEPVASDHVCDPPQSGGGCGCSTGRSGGGLLGLLVVLFCVRRRKE